MPKLNVEGGWDGISTSQVIEPGTYLASIDKVEETTSQNGKPYWNVEFTIQEEPYVGRKVWDIFMLNAEALWKLKRLAKAVGLDLSGRNDIDSDDLMNAECHVVIANEMYDGELRNRVKGYK